MVKVNVAFNGCYMLCVLYNDDGILRISIAFVFPFSKVQSSERIEESKSRTHRELRC